MLYLSKYHCEVNSNRLIPVSIHFCMFVISRGDYFYLNIPQSVGSVFGYICRQTKIFF